MVQRTFRNLLFLVPLALWSGAAVGLTFLTTPVIFGALDRDAASRLVGHLFPAYFRFGLVCMALALAAALASRLALPDRSRRLWAIPGVLAATLALMLIAGLVLEPQVAAVQAQIPSFVTDTDSPARLEFRRLHSLSSILNLVMLLLTAAAWVLTALDPRLLLASPADSVYDSPQRRGGRRERTGTGIHEGTRRGTNKGEEKMREPVS